MRIDFIEIVNALAKPGQEIGNDLAASPGHAHLLHMAVGVSGEGGELLDAIKKVAIYNKPIDRANVVEELGDLRFYMQGIMNHLCITEEEVIDGNIAKLSKRYESLKYSDTSAQQRADKVGD